MAEGEKDTEELYRRDWPEERKAAFIRHEIDTCYEPMPLKEREEAEAGLRRFLEAMSDPRVNWDFDKCSRIYGYHFFNRGPGRRVERSRLRRFFDPVDDLIGDLVTFFDHRVDALKRRWRRR